MPNIWITSDTHFGHANLLKFKREDGTPVRDFESVHAMDEHIIERWNAVVRPNDEVWHLGDVTFQRDLDDFYDTMERLKGRKYLILGNHDHHHDMTHYMVHFQKIMGAAKLHGMLLTHYPVAACSAGTTNIHGHVHEKQPFKRFADSVTYVNVSVEATRYEPVNLDTILQVKNVQEIRQGTAIVWDGSRNLDDGKPLDD